MKLNLFYFSLSLLYIYALILLAPNFSFLFIGALLISIIIIMTQITFKYKNNYSKNLVYCDYYLISIFFVGIWMLIVTLFNIFSGFGNYSISYIIQDIISLLIICSGYLIVISNQNLDFSIKKYYSFISIIAVIAGILSFYNSNFSLGREANVWKPQYIWWGLLYPWAYIFLFRITVIKKSIIWLIISLLTSGLYISLGLLFGKRIVIYELSILLLLIFFYFTKNNKIVISNNYKIILFITTLFMSLYYLYNNINLNNLNLLIDTIDRFKNLNIREFDRFIEFLNIFTEYPITFILTGTGFGSYHSGPGGINLHIGWLNYIYKGGIFLFFIECSIFIMAIKSLFKTKDGMEFFLAASVVFGYMVILISSSWVASPLTVHYSVIKFLFLKNLSEKNINQIAIL